MNIPYDLSRPTEQYKLSKKYIEISGIWPIEQTNSLAFVQDEAIRVHQFNLSTKKVAKYIKHGSGDSEDIVIIKNTAYILTAGKKPSIYRIKGYDSSSAECERFDLKLDAKYDPEGLCYDPKEKRLLIACKGSPIKGDKVRKVFAFDIQSGTRSNSPVFVLDSRDFLNKPKDTFNPSGMAIHPESNDAFFIGTKGEKMIVCYGLDGLFKGSWTLDKKKFVQPEGIAFRKSGDLIISNEGRKSKKGKKTIKAKIFIFTVQTKIG